MRDRFDLVCTFAIACTYIPCVERPVFFSFCLVLREIGIFLEL